MKHGRLFSIVILIMVMASQFGCSPPTAQPTPTPAPTVTTPMPTNTPARATNMVVGPLLGNQDIEWLRRQLGKDLLESKVTNILGSSQTAKFSDLLIPETGEMKEALLPISHHFYKGEVFVLGYEFNGSWRGILLAYVDEILGSDTYVMVGITQRSGQSLPLSGPVTPVPSGPQA